MCELARYSERMITSHWNSNYGIQFLLSVKCRGLEESKGRRRRPENLVYRAGARLFLSAGARLFRSTNPPGGWGVGPDLNNISFVFKNLNNLSPMAPQPTQIRPCLFVFSDHFGGFQKSFYQLLFRRNKHRVISRQPLEDTILLFRPVYLRG